MKCPRFQAKETIEEKKARELEEVCHLVYIDIYNAMRQGKQSILVTLMREHTGLLMALNVNGFGAKMLRGNHDPYPVDEIPYMIYWNPVGEKGLHEDSDDISSDDDDKGSDLEDYDSD